jgi:hypothetical protein
MFGRKVFMSLPSYQFLAWALLFDLVGGGSASLRNVCGVHGVSSQKRVSS